MSRRPGLALIPCLALLAPLPLRAGFPQPDATFFGTITAGGSPVGSGSLAGIVHRDGEVLLEVPGEFVMEGDVPYYVLRIRMTAGDGGQPPQAARSGDVLHSITLDGQEIAVPDEKLVPGMTRELAITVAGVRFFRGDCDSNRTLEITDAIFVLGHLFLGGSTPACERACDSNGDDLLNLSDALFTLGYLFLSGPPPPQPTGSCGFTSAASVLGCAGQCS